MQYKILLTLFTSLLLFSSCNSQTTEKDFPKNLDELVVKAISEKHIPSIAVGIVKDGQVAFAKTFGFANVEDKIEATNQTMYQLGSITKTMTGHVLVRLIEEGVISLSDTLASFFPNSLNFPIGPNGEIVTIQHMANHSAGFPHYPENLERVDPNPILGYNKEQLYRGIEMVDIESIPGQSYHYSNFGYGILGTALENITGKPLNDLLQTYLFETAGMQHTSLLINEDIRKKLAVPYLEVDPYKATEPWQMEALAGAGNVFTNLDDMQKFLLHLLEKNETNNFQQSPLLNVNESGTWRYGIGCFVVNTQNIGTLRIHHGGDVDGYASTIDLYPEYNLGIVIMTNNGDGSILADVFNDVRNIITDHYITESE